MKRRRNTRVAANRDITKLLLTACAVVPSMAAALPATRDADTANRLFTGRSHASATALPFDDRTSSCALMLGNRGLSVAPFDTPKDERTRCRNEAVKGNLAAQAIYGQMMAYGYGGERDPVKGLAVLKSAAIDGSPLAQRMLGNLDRDGIAVPQNDAAARRWFEAAAAGGDATSMVLLGAMSANGEGQSVDNVAAYRYFARAAEAGSANGAANAARFALTGRGVSKDLNVAAAWMIRGAAGGDAGAQFMLGLALLRGEGVPRDPEKGVAWLQASVRQGNAEAIATLGDVYVSGIGVQRDERKGFELMSQAAGKGSVYAQRRLGNLYESGTGTARDDAKARAWYRKAALEGDEAARFALSNLYRAGRGGPVDLEAAIGWMRGAADAGMATAQNDLGVMLREGWGTNRNPVEARAWFEKANAQGLGVASLNLAMYAFRGEGEPVDYSKAFRLASLGATRGSDAAAVTAAAMAWTGQGTPVDKPQAMRWYRFAADHGNVEAARWIGNQYLAGTVVPRDEQLGLHYLTLATDAGDQSSRVVLGAYLTEHHQSLSGKTGVEWLETAAQGRVPAAYSALGYTYWRGVGVAKDSNVALKWFSQGAQLGDPASRAWLCNAYAFGGSGVQQHAGYAARWCIPVAREGNVDAMRILATSGNNIGSARERVYWQWRLADHGEAAYQSMLGDAYDLGDGVTPDLTAASYWFRRAAEQGNTSAQESLAWHLLTGLGGRVDEYEAFEWASKAAPSNAEAKRMVGMAYAYGRGIGRDRAVARVWLERALADGDAWAASDLALLSENGPLVTRDETRAIALHQQAARAGVEPSEIALALRAVATGTEADIRKNERRWLIPADPASNVWFDGALSADAERLESWEGMSCLNEALLGNPLMQYETGMRFVTGNGVPRDRALGAAWIARARENFDAQSGMQTYAAAIRVIETRLAGRMSDSEMRRARSIAANLNATVVSQR